MKTKKRKKKFLFNSLKSWFNSFTEPFEYFYLGFLASVGLAFGSALLFNVLRETIEFYTKWDILIYSRIGFSVFYIFFLIYSYKFLDMKKNKILRNGFTLFAVIYILGEIYVWITVSIK